MLTGQRTAESYKQRGNLLVRRLRGALTLPLPTVFFLPKSVGLANHEEKKAIVVRCRQEDFDEEPVAPMQKYKVAWSNVAEERVTLLRYVHAYAGYSPSVWGTRLDYRIQGDFCGSLPQPQISSGAAGRYIHANIQRHHY